MQSTVITEDVLAYAISLPAGFHSISTATSTINGIGVAATGYILRRPGNDTIVALYSITSGVLNINHYNGSTWLGWQQCITKSDFAAGRVNIPANTEYIEVSFGKTISNPSIMATNIYSNSKRITASIAYITNTGFRIFPYDTDNKAVPVVDTSFF